MTEVGEHPFFRAPSCVPVQNAIQVAHATRIEIENSTSIGISALTREQYQLITLVIQVFL